jgi:hypothetical protein
MPRNALTDDSLTEDKSRVSCCFDERHTRLQLLVAGYESNFEAWSELRPIIPPTYFDRLEEDAHMKFDAYYSLEMSVRR